MLKLWSLEEATVHQIIDLFDQPKPAFNTVSTQIRILEKKKIVKHKKEGRGYVYLPKITKEEYQKSIVNHLVDNYFNGSKKELISHLSSHQSLADLL